MAGRTTAPARSGAAPGLGPRIRRLRRHRGLSQAHLAEQLGISASYLNLMEQGHRNVTAPVLIRLSQVLGVGFEALAPEDDARLQADVMEMFGDPLFEDHDLKTPDVADFVTGCPTVAAATLTLFDAWQRAQRDAESLSERLSGESGGAPGALLPTERISDFIQAESNHFPSIEEVAEAVRAETGLDRGDGVFTALTSHLERRHGIAVAVLPPELRHGSIRRYDPVSRTLVVSELLPRESRNFQVAQQIGLLAARDAIDALIDRAGLGDSDAQPLARSSLAAYFAGALLMPYAPFLRYAEAVRYDIEQIEHHFGVSFEQACHRLTTLQRPGAAGVPFHFLRVDVAGNVSKRFSRSGLPIPRYAGACPRWNVYTAFLTPGQIHTQISQMEDGSAFFCIARAFRKRGGGYMAPESIYAIGLGCRLEDADRLVYAEGIDLDSQERAVPVGVACRLCQRTDCRQRAFPPMQRRLRLDENVRGVSPYVTGPLA